MIDVVRPSLAYSLEGPSDRPVLVLAHGLGLSAAMWDPQVSALKSGFRVLRYDTRGHGASPSPHAPCTIADLGGDLVALLDTLNVGRFHLCGLSMGGLVGMWLATHARERLLTLTLANTSARIGPPTMWNDRIATVRERGMSAISAAAIERWFTQPFLVGHKDVVDSLRRTMERTSADGYVRCSEAIRDADLRNAITAIATPTLVIGGTRDMATPLADAQFLSANIRGAELVALDCAHLSNVELPHAFNDALLAFCLRREDGASRGRADRRSS